MKKILFSIICLLLVNFVFAQVVDSVAVKTTTKTTKTIKKTTTTTIVTTEKIDTIYQNDTIRKKNRRIRVVATEKKNIIKLATFGINYERVLSSRITAQFNTHYLFKGQNTASSGNGSGQTLTTESSGFGVGAEVRFYPKSALNGFFVGLSPRYQNYNFRVPNGTTDNGSPADAKANWNAYNVALLLGKQWVFNDIISFEVYGGPAFVGGVLEITKGNRDAFTLFGTGANTGVTLRFGITVGFAFSKK